MAFHRGNAFFTNVTADNLRTDWQGWVPSTNDTHSTIIATPLQHARFFNTKNFVVVSLHVTVNFDTSTPENYTKIFIDLPATLRVKSETSFKNSCIIERRTITNERKFSQGMLIADGESKGGVDNETFLFLDRIFVENLGQFVSGQTYDIRGQIVFEPS
tara:strand:- start:677 stop:1153 length:477 start_codon:yes stop_codon:yes gene_type:complete